MVQQRILAILLAHHRAAGWATPMPRGELLARLRGWHYGEQTIQRGDGVAKVYTGIDRTQVEEKIYNTAQADLSQALFTLFGRSLLLLGTAWSQEMQSAETITRELEQRLAQDLANPQPAYERYLALGKCVSLEEYIERRRSTVQAWQAGHGRPGFKVQRVALTASGRTEAEATAGELSPIQEAPSIGEKYPQS